MGNIYSTVPYSAQISQIKLPLSCSVVSCTDSGTDQTFAYPITCNASTAVTRNAVAIVSLTSPLSAIQGQSVYYSDFAETVAFYTDYAPGDPDYFDWNAFNINTTLGIINGSPSYILIHDAGTYAGRSGSPDTTGGAFKFGSAAPQGPISYFNLGPSDISLQNVNFYSVGYHGEGHEKTFVRNNTCVPTIVPDAISTLSVVSSEENADGTSISVSNNGSSNFPVNPVGTKFTRANIPLFCGLGKDATDYEPYNFTIQGYVPTSISPGGIFNLTDVVAFLTLPPAVTGEFSTSTADIVDIVVTLGADAEGDASSPAGFVLGIGGATPQEYDISRQITSDPSTASNTLFSQRLIESNFSIPLPMPFPIQNYLTVGPFTAASDATEVAFNVQSLAGYIYSTNGVEEDIACRVDSEVTLFSIPVVSSTS